MNKRKTITIPTHKEGPRCRTMGVAPSIPSRAERIRAPPNSFGEATLRAIDARLMRERPAPQRPKLQQAITVLHADITRLHVDAIVNAANDRLLGCFRPEHRCVDNVIHGAAGPRLRDECAAQLRRGARAPLLTGGYCLPASFVVHAVGPVSRAGGGL